MSKSKRIDHIGNKCKEMEEEVGIRAYGTRVYGVPPHTRIFLTCGAKEVLLRHEVTSKRFTYKDTLCIREHHNVAFIRTVCGGVGQWS